MAQFSERVVVERTMDVYRELMPGFHVHAAPAPVLQAPGNEAAAT